VAIVALGIQSRSPRFSHSAALSSLVPSASLLFPLSLLSSLCQLSPFFPVPFQEALAYHCVPWQ